MQRCQFLPLLSSSAEGQLHNSTLLVFRFRCRVSSTSAVSLSVVPVQRVSPHLVRKALQVDEAAPSLRVVEEVAQLDLELREGGSSARLGMPALGDHPEQFRAAVGRPLQPVAVAHPPHHFARTHRRVRRRTCKQRRVQSVMDMHN